VDQRLKHSNNVQNAVFFVLKMAYNLEEHNVTTYLHNSVLYLHVLYMCAFITQTALIQATKKSIDLPYQQRESASATCIFL
jgi:hypothetical protein